jgi:hypothetical protein
LTHPSLLSFPGSVLRAGHLGLIYLATAIFVVGALLALKGLGERREMRT